MISLSHVAARLGPAVAGLLLTAATVLATPVQAQGTTPDATSARNNPAVATDGATLIHGNYCGAGNRPGQPPIDALDLACMNHDACTPTGGIPTCDCNARLRDEAAAVSNDARQAPELRSLASLTAAAASMMLCKPSINAAAPVAPVERRPAAESPATEVQATRAQAVAPVVQEAPLPPQAPVAQAAPVVQQAPASQEAPVEQAPAVAAPMSIVPAAAAPTTRPLP